jgi:type II secretory pathway component PulF
MPTSSGAPPRGGRGDGRFRYRAATAAGGVVEGTLQAATREQAVEQLRRQQLVPVSVEAAGHDGAGLARPLFAGRGARRRDLSLWTRTLATLLEAGAPMDRGLAVAGAQVSHPGVVAAAADLRARVVAGGTLADAMRVHPAVFGPLHAAMVEAGEATGSLDRACLMLADYLDEDDAWRDQLQAALLYPVLMAIVATVGVLVLLLVVVPRFSSLLADLGGTLPLSTRLLVGVGGFVGTWWWLLGLGTALVVSAVATWLATPAATLAWHRTRLGWPVVGRLERAVATARFTRALGVLLQGGMPLLSAWRLAQGGVTNRALGQDLRAAAERVGRGEPVATATAGVLAPLATQLMAVGDESGQLAAMALRSATVHELEVKRTLRTIAGLVEPALIVLFGGLVGLVALAMLQAIYAVNAGIGVG